MSTLKERIAELSKDLSRGWQAELARHCEVAAPSVSDWVTGKTKTLEGDHLMRAAHYFKCNPKWLSSGEGPKRPANAADSHLVTGTEARDVTSIYPEGPYWPFTASQAKVRQLLSPEDLHLVDTYLQGIINVRENDARKSDAAP